MLRKVLKGAAGPFGIKLDDLQAECTEFLFPYRTEAQQFVMKQHVGHDKDIGQLEHCPYQTAFAQVNDAGGITDNNAHSRLPVLSWRFRSALKGAATVRWPCSAR